jgi:hypothetical protein
MREWKWPRRAKAELVAPKSDPSRWLVALKPREDGNQMKADEGGSGAR